MALCHTLSSATNVSLPQEGPGKTQVELSKEDNQSRRSLHATTSSADENCLFKHHLNAAAGGNKHEHEQADHKKQATFLPMALVHS